MGRRKPRSAQTDAKYQRAIKIIIDNFGKTARELIQSGHRYLTPKIIRRIANSSVERQQYEIEQVCNGWRPFTTKTTVFDTNSFGEVTSRLARAAGCVNKAAALTCRIAALGKFSCEEIREVVDTLHSLSTDCGKLWEILCAGGWMPDNEVRRSHRPKISDEKVWTNEDLRRPNLCEVLGDLNRAASFVAKCRRDLPRSPNLPRTREQVHAARIRLFAMQSHLWALKETLARASGELSHASTLKRVATHRRPDVDALVGVWLVERFLVNEAVDVVFLPYH